MNQQIPPRPPIENPDKEPPARDPVRRKGPIEDPRPPELPRRDPEPRPMPGEPPPRIDDPRPRPPPAHTLVSAAASSYEGLDSLFRADR